MHRAQSRVVPARVAELIDWIIALCAGVQGVWAVRFWPEGMEYEAAFSQHAYLILGLWTGTKVRSCFLHFASGCAGLPGPC